MTIKESRNGEDITVLVTGIEEKETSTRQPVRTPVSWSRNVLGVREKDKPSAGGSKPD